MDRFHGNANEVAEAAAVRTVYVFDMFGAVHQVAASDDREMPKEERREEGLREAARITPSVVQRWLAGAAFAVLGLGLTITAEAARADTLLNVSYDPTRELYREYDKAFAAHWEALGNAPLEIKSSHAGSGAQARSVIDGLDAQVVTLALASDINAIAEKTGKIPEDWQTKLPHNSAPYTSTIVFLVRDGNPKDITDWGDLVKDGVEVITPNPKTSGGARWNYLAAWAWADRQFGGNQDEIREYMRDLFAHVPVLDTGARGATTTFAQRGIGDVLLAWENEAFLATKELGEGQFEIIRPSVSILAEPTVAVVEGNLHTGAQRAAAEEYLSWLFSPEAQAIAMKNYYRAWDPSLAEPESVALLPPLDLVTIDQFGGWKEVQPEHFGDGGVFDQIFEVR